jgi:hypothetical protein
MIELEKKISAQKLSLVKFKEGIEKHDNFQEAIKLTKYKDWNARNNSLVDRFKIYEAEEPILVKNQWCWKPMRSDNVFRGSDKSIKSNALNLINFENFTKDIEDNALNFEKYLKGNLKYLKELGDKLSTPTRTPNEIYGSKSFKRFSCGIPEITCWTEGVRKTIYIIILSDRYQIETSRFDNMGDLRKTISL